MRLHRLTVKGVTVYQTEQVVDFENLPDGLVAVCGANGSGKTTLLECIYAALYRELPTRPGSLYAWCHGRDAKIELEFSMGPQRYKATVLVDAISEKMEAYFSGGGFKTNGKLQQFDQAVATVVGPKALLLSSVIGVQDRSGSFLDLPVADRKTLFAQLLNLGHLKTIEASAKAKADAELAAIENLRGEVRAKQQIVDAAARTVEELETLREVITATQQQIETAVKEADAQAENITRFSEQIGGFKADEAEVERLKRELVQAAATMNTLSAKLTGRRQVLTSDNNAIAKKQQDLEAKMEELRQRITNNQQVMAMGPEIDKAVERSGQITLLIATLREEILAIATHETENLRLLGEHQRSANALAQVNQSIEWNQRLVQELQTIPCAGKPPYDRCVKITTSIEAKQVLPGLLTERDHHEATAEQLKAQLTGRSNGFRERRTVASEVAALEKELKSLESKTKYQPAFREAVTKIAGYEEQLVLLQAQLVSLPALADLRTDAVVVDLLQQTDKALDAADALKTAHEQAVLRLAAQAGILAEKAAAMDARQKARDKSDAADRALVALRGREAVLVGKCADNAALQADIDKLVLQVQEASNEATEWLMLSTAFGPKGIAQLEIDISGPAIGAIVNDLLVECFSTRFTVKLSTQREGKDGRLIEDFDALVNDGRVGKWASVDALSGGEKTIVGEALALALAIYNKGTAEYMTCIRDETTGSLDVDTAPKYVTMLKKAAKLGNFAKIIFITHSVECGELADAKIRCENGKVSIEL